MQIRDDLILIASTDQQGGIGRDNQLLMRIPEDMRHFRSHTLGQTVIVGRKTLDSFKGGQPLPDRKTVVLSTQSGLPVPGAVVVANLHELFDVIQGDQGRIYVIGGESVYRQLVGFCCRAILTRFDAVWEADARLPELTPDTGWVCVKEEPWQMSEKGIRFRMEMYERHPAT